MLAFSDSFATDNSYAAQFVHFWSRTSTKCTPTCDIHCSSTKRSLKGWSLVMLRRRESNKFSMNHRQRAQTSLLRKTYPEKLSVGRDLCSFRATRCHLSPGISHHSFSPCSRVPEKEIVRTQGTYEPSSNDSPVLTHDSLFFSLVLLV